METNSKTLIEIQTTVNDPIEKVWQVWGAPEHILNWNHASDDWHCPKATNDLREGGRFVYTMAAKDGSVSFDFEGIYSEVKKYEVIEYTMLDGRVARVEFTKADGSTRIVEMFEPETENTEDLQRDGWQSILNNFKNYCEQTELHLY